jgi:hypothetical protein
MGKFNYQAIKLLLLQGFPQKILLIKKYLRELGLDNFITKRTDSDHQAHRLVIFLR